MTIKDKISGKNILFFSVQTFKLEQEVKHAMEKNGAEVWYYDERPSNNNFTKGIIRLKRKLYQKRIDEYYNRILDDIKGQSFDFLFVNRGEVITADFLIKFSKMYPECERIFFTWDSFTNHGHPTTILKYFHKRFTFELDDAIKYGIGFRPLFYLDSYKDLKIVSSSYQYDLLFLGTAHTDRYPVYKKVAEWATQNKYSFFKYFYMHSRAVYLYQRFFDKSFKGFQYSLLSFKSLSTDEIMKLYKQSKVILDINHTGQKGLTMRTFEAIGAGKKLITTNSEIKKYPFWNPNNFYVIQRNYIDIDQSFFNTEYIPLADDLYYGCSIEGWLSDIFLKNEKDDWKAKLHS
ncbi:glycosyltransferase family protein [Chryseobacterium lacus]|uniref:glycosyltransferase family protein n=1 Tax=Chryseobacterium lacus TaxID=2058346 RepID=UPI000F864760|nr:lipopolysaccharide biosynthesis protein [Chryseobacterium lacus]RST27503.1 lipopolysaccharide biosynthesis protein [Chryseobacterium lacus]